MWESIMRDKLVQMQIAEWRPLAGVARRVRWAAPSVGGRSGGGVFGSVGDFAQLRGGGRGVEGGGRSGAGPFGRGRGCN